MWLLRDRDIKSHTADRTLNSWHFVENSDQDEDDKIIWDQKLCRHDHPIETVEFYLEVSSNQLD
jgi:hypothetical protein